MVIPSQILLMVNVCIQAGVYIMTMFDWYSGGLNLIVISICEVCGIAWIYGVRNAVFYSRSETYRKLLVCSVLTTD